MDKESLDRSIARRLLDHIENRTTDLVDQVLELPVEIYTRSLVGSVRCV